MADEMVTVKMSRIKWQLLRANLLLAAIDEREMAENCSGDESRMHMAVRQELLDVRREIIRQVFPTHISEE